MTKTILPVFLVFFALTVNAVVIVPPVVYFVTLSIATFLSNVLIALLAIIAVSGFANKKFFGKKVSELFSYFFSWIKKIVIAFISMAIALFVINPIEVFTIIQAAILTFILCLMLFFISNYSTYRVIQKPEKTKLVTSFSIFSLLVALLFLVSVFLSLETQVINTENSSLSYIQNNPLLPSLDKIAPFADSMSGAQVGIVEKPQESDDEITQPKLTEPNLWFYPSAKEQCIIIIGSQNFTFTPIESCYFYENSSLVRIFCPISISKAQVNQAGTVNLTATGSCKAQQTITITSNGFEVEN